MRHDVRLRVRTDYVGGVISSVLLTLRVDQPGDGTVAVDGGGLCGGRVVILVCYVPTVVLGQTE